MHTILRELNLICLRLRLASERCRIQIPIDCLYLAVFACSSLCSKKISILQYVDLVKEINNHKEAQIMKKQYQAGETQTNLKKEVVSDVLRPLGGDGEGETGFLERGNTAGSGLDEEMCHPFLGTAV